MVLTGHFPALFDIFQHEIINDGALRDAISYPLLANRNPGTNGIHTPFPGVA